MRIIGTCLLIFGCFLTLTVVWAAIGFLMMGFGLICLLVAEHETNDVLRVLANQREAAQRERIPVAAPTAKVDQNALPPGTANKIRGQLSSMRMSLPEDAAQPGFAANTGHDLKNWQLLPESDQDLARTVEVALPFGAKSAEQRSLIGETIRMKTGMHVDASAPVESLDTQVAGFASDESVNAAEADATSSIPADEVLAETEPTNDTDRIGTEETKNLRDMFDRMSESRNVLRR